MITEDQAKELVEIMKSYLEQNSFGSIGENVDKDDYMSLRYDYPLIYTYWLDWLFWYGKRRDKDV